MSSDRLHDGLRELNARSSHRFTGVYVFAPPMLECVSLFDRENPAIRSGSSHPLRSSLCGIVGDQDAPFATRDASSDMRLADHPAGDSAVSYHGFPLKRDTGESIGTLCFWDLVPRAPLCDDACRYITTALPSFADAVSLALSSLEPRDRLTSLLGEESVVRDDIASSEHDRAHVRQQIRSYVRGSRRNGATPERVLIELKGILASATIGMDHEQRAALTRDVIGWAIEDYYRG